MTTEPSASFRDRLVLLFGMLENSERRQLSVVVLLTVLSAFTELLTIGAIVPFLSLLAASSVNFHMRWFQEILGGLGARTHEGELLVATAVLCCAAVASGLLQLLLTRKSQNFTSNFGHRLAVDLQRRLLAQSYSWHVSHNSSVQLAAITKVELLTNAVLLSLIQAAAATLLVLVVITLLVQIAPLATIAAGAALGSCYYFLGVLSRRRFEHYSEVIDEAYERRIRIVQEGLSGIRDIILDGSQSKILEDFRLADLQLVQAHANAKIVAAVPRSLIEPFGIITIAAVALFLSGREGGFVDALPILGAITLGAQRLLPLVNQLYQGWSAVAANTHIIDDLVQNLSLPIDSLKFDVPPLNFAHSIEFRNVSYVYSGRSHPAVDGLTFKIRHGSRVKLVGATGAGKSTTADLLMGLLEPTSGEIVVDGVPLTKVNRQSWRANIAHVPQMLFVADATVADNITLEKSDTAQMREAAALAQLDDLITSLPEAYETRVGERGAQISGGQRQRLAIARAIYKNAPLLVFDEATSALDRETEAAVLSTFDVLQKQGRTIVIIAHRESTTLRCDHVLRLRDGRLVEDSVVPDDVDASTPEH